MKNLIKKVLTDKKARKMSTLSTLMLTVVAVGMPWGSK